MNSTLAVCVLLWQLSEGELSQCDGQITFHMMKGCKMGNSFLLCCYEQITDEDFFIISFSNTSHQLNPPKLTFRHILAIILYQVHFKLQHTNHLQGIMSSIVLSTSHFPLIFSRIHRETTLQPSSTSCGCQNVSACVTVRRRHRRLWYVVRSRTCSSSMLRHTILYTFFFFLIPGGDV